jgi:hypothetical protein
MRQNSTESNTAKRRDRTARHITWRHDTTALRLTTYHNFVIIHDFVDISGFSQEDGLHNRPTINDLKLPHTPLWGGSNCL